jgi:outer membrane immunogenic protein
MLKLFAAAAAITFVTGASAADLPIVDEPALQAAMAPSWSGAYLGLQVGAVAGTFDDTYPPAPLASIDGDLAGGTIGVYGGWNAQLESVVLGVDADLNYSTVHGSGANLGGDTMNVDLSWTGSIRGRAGLAADNLLFYVAGGLAAANASIEITDINGASVASAQDILLGWTAGAGVEVAFSDNWIGRLDYRYSDYGSIDYAVSNIDEGSVALTSHAVTLGVAYKF